MIMKDKMPITDTIRATVTELSPVGLIKFGELKERFGKDRKKNPEYIRLREKLLEEHGHIKQPKRKLKLFRRLSK